MAQINELFQSADWKKEKHIPVIDAPSGVKKGEFFRISVCVGKDIPHPNTTAHHIRWITLFFLPDGEKFPYQIGRAEFDSHGESTLGADTSTVFTHSEATVAMKTEKPGTILASSYCNIHGLWQNAAKIEVK